MKTRTLALLLVLSSAPALSAQWLHRYPLVQGYRHHIYVEGYELPGVATGCLDPAPSPDGRSVYFASMGWIWKLDLGTGKALRVSRGAHRDSRPALSRDGKMLAFLRDDSTSIRIVLLDLASGAERDLPSPSGRLDLDPAFMPDGKALVCSSSREGNLDLWRVDLGSGEWRRLSSGPGIKLKPQPSPDGKGLLYLHKMRAGLDQLRWMDLESGQTKVLRDGPILSLTRPALSPDGRSIALALPLPGEDRYRLYGAPSDGGDHGLLPMAAPGQPLCPAWGPDGRSVWFAEDPAKGNHAFALRKATVGGDVETVPIRSWDFGAPTATLRLRARQGGQTVPARLEIVDAQGHPLIPEGAAARVDSESGKVYVHVSGETTLTVPAGGVRVTACRGFAPFPAVRTASLAVGASASLDLELEPLPFPEAARWLSGDLHFHMNYGGAYRLEPEDLRGLLAAEDLDLGEPMAANLDTRQSDAAWFGWRSTGGRPWLRFGQEARSNYFGHLGLNGFPRTFSPGFYGPGYPPALEALPVLNADVFQATRGQGGLLTYVHPTALRHPLESAAGAPAALFPDMLTGQGEALEVSGLWTDERGASELLACLLNLGLPVLPTAGTDAFPNFFRTQVPGSNRVYVRVEGEPSPEAYWKGLRAGRLFVSSGPRVDFRVQGQFPGTVLQGGRVAWTLDLASPRPLEHLEILVNGQVARTLAPLGEGGAIRHSGVLDLPKGGWIAFRTWDDRAGWPSMNSRSFAMTGPFWVGRTGSLDPRAARASAADALRMLDFAEAAAKELNEATRERFMKQIQEARGRVKAIVEGAGR